MIKMPEEIKDDVSEKELKTLVFIYKRLNKSRRNLLSVGSAMLLASQNAEEDETEEGKVKEMA